MKFEEFQKSLAENHPSEQLSKYLQSLWYDAKGDWNKAHEIIQDIEDKNAAWIHAYLHRKEDEAAAAVIAVFEGSTLADLVSDAGGNKPLCDGTHRQIEFRE